MNFLKNRSARKLDKVKHASHRNWWHSDLLQRYVNEQICGTPVDGLGAISQALKQTFAGGIFQKGASIGCGVASKELALVESGVVREFDLFEISKVRIGEGSAAILVLLCHIFLRRDGPAIGALQHGHRGRLLTSAPISRRRMVAIEFGM